MTSRSKVHGKDAAFIELIAADADMRDRYNPLPEQSRGRVLDSFLFGILTATEPTPAAERAMAAIKDANYPTDLDTMRGITHAAGLVYWPTKARYAAAFIAAYNADPARYTPAADELCSEYRDRVFASHVLGLGFVKTSFACYLAYGGGDVICPDRHIINMYLGHRFEDWMFKASAKAIAFLRTVEQYFRDLAVKYGWRSASALQWAAWCEGTGEFTDHAMVSA